jgi:hypothetical protein
MASAKKIIMDRMFEFFQNKGFTYNQVKDAADWAIKSYDSQTFGTLWDRVSRQLSKL